MLFILDENVIIEAMASSEVEPLGGRYVKVGALLRDAYDLILQIIHNGHGIAMSYELWAKYMNWQSVLQNSLTGLDPRPMNSISDLWRDDRVVYEPNPSVVNFPPNFPDEDDLYLAYLAIATGAILVTKDIPILNAAASGDWGFEAIPIAEALRRARVA